MSIAAEAPGLELPHWRRLRHGDTVGLAAAAAELHCVFPPAELGFEEDESFVYLPVTVLVPIAESEGEPREVVQRTVIFGLGETALVTLEPADGYKPFDRAAAILKRRPDVPRDNHGTMYALLLAINSFGDQNIEYASASLEAMNSEIYAVTVGTDEGYELTNNEVGQTLNALNRMEELISRIQESQLLLERAARYLRLELDREDVDFREQLAVLISDIGAVKEHAGFEHNKVRYLQQSVMTSLNAKQNQVAKVFTIIAVVFLPPTLIASIYGMNFEHMPELGWKWGFPVTIMLTLTAALLPLWYIKRKGWLR
ncbi:MAG TPA: CorA family divalent cation transporter [Sphingomonadaceae bacterium]|nr:CorA family divalent cation transporter [Sphingomonadaceae bacterium]